MKIKTTGFLGAALTVWLMGTTGAQAGSLYKWVGEDGSVHYSAQSPILSKSQTLQRVRVQARGSREIMAPDFDSNRNIVAAEANAMMTQDEPRPNLIHAVSEPTMAKRKPAQTEAASKPNIQARATDRASASSGQHDGSPKTLVDALTDPVQMQ